VIISETKNDTFKAIKLSIASPKQIMDWSHGEVTKPETINYRTQKKTVSSAKKSLVQPKTGNVTVASTNAFATKA
jgi:DNA-directed RNA polymerase beta' subunit